MMHMKGINQAITALAAALSFTISTHAADMTMDVTANRQNIYIGESVVLTVKVSGLDSNAIEPDLSAITNCNIRLLDTHSSSYSSIVFVNGKMTKEGFSGRTLTYELAPLSIGTFIAGPVRLTVNGKTISANGPSITVTGVEQQDYVTLSVKASRDAVLVDETFDIFFSITVKRLPGQFADIDPLAPNEPPLLNIPFLEMAPIQGLETPNIEQFLKNHLVHRNDAPGFSINKYTTRSDPMDFMSFFNMGQNLERKARFIFDKAATNINTSSCFNYMFKLSYTPKEEGSHTFGPVTFKGPIVVGVDTSNRGIMKPIFAVGSAATVRVIPPPEKDRPLTYISAIGSNVVIDATLDAQTCKVGDPLKLSIGISGNIRLDNVSAPSLNVQTNLTKDFKIYEDTVQTAAKDGKKIFTYTVRPTTAGTLEFPPVEISYFNSLSRSYQTARSQPIPVRANESQEIVAANIIETVTNKTVIARKGTQQESQVIAPIDVNPEGAIPDPITLETWEKIILVSSPILYILVATGALITKRRKLVLKEKKREIVIRQALSMLRECLTMTQHDAAYNANEVLCSAIRKYLSARFGSVEVAITPQDAKDLLYANGIEASASLALCAILEKSFNAAYSSLKSNHVNSADDCRQAITVIENIEKSLQTMHSKKTHHSIYAILLVTVLCRTTESCFAGNEIESQFLWNEANSRMASAASPDDFRAAATVYRKLADSGVRNGIVFYNMGTALLKAQQ